MAAIPARVCALGVVEQRLAGAPHGIGAVRAQSAWTRRTPSRLAANCARRSPSRSCGTWQLSRIRSSTSSLQHAPVEEPDRRDAQPLLEDVRVAAVDEVGVVREVGDEGDEPPLDEDRRDEDDVRQVGAAAGVGVVADEDVAGPRSSSG